MKLSEKQADFLWMVNDLLTWIRPVIETNNVLLKVIEWNRRMETQRQYVAEGLSRTLQSKHLISLAVDFGIIKNGKFLRESSIYTMMGEQWRNIGGRWGGEFQNLIDPYHFEYNEKRRKEYLDTLGGENGS